MIFARKWLIRFCFILWAWKTWRGQCYMPWRKRFGAFRARIIVTRCLWDLLRKHASHIPPNNWNSIAHNPLAECHRHAALTQPKRQKPPILSTDQMPEFQLGFVNKSTDTIHDTQSNGGKENTMTHLKSEVFAIQEGTNAKTKRNRVMPLMSTFAD